jgi:hypothetical protein
VGYRLLYRDGRKPSGVGLSCQRWCHDIGLTDRGPVLLCAGQGRCDRQMPCGRCRRRGRLCVPYYPGDKDKDWDRDPGGDHPDDPPQPPPPPPPQAPLPPRPRVRPQRLSPPPLAAADHRDPSPSPSPSPCPWSTAIGAIGATETDPEPEVEPEPEPKLVRVLLPGPLGQRLMTPLVTHFYRLLHAARVDYARALISL